MDLKLPIQRLDVCAASATQVRSTARSRLNRRAFGLAVAGSGGLLGCAEKAEFKPFVSVAGRFEVSTPVELAPRSQALEMEGVANTLYSLAAERDGVVYAVNYFDIPEDINRELLRTRPSPYQIPSRATMLERNGWIAKSIAGDELKVTAQVTAYGEKIAATSGNKKQHIYIRLLWHTNRIYQLMTGYPIKPSYLQEQYAKRFVWSFKILPQASGAGPAGAGQ